MLRGWLHLEHSNRGLWNNTIFVKSWWRLMDSPSTLKLNIFASAVQNKSLHALLTNIKIQSWCLWPCGESSFHIVQGGVIGLWKWRDVFVTSSGCVPDISITINSDKDASTVLTRHNYQLQKCEVDSSCPRGEAGHWAICLWTDRLTCRFGSECLTSLHTDVYFSSAIS